MNNTKSKTHFTSNEGGYVMLDVAFWPKDDYYYNRLGAEMFFDVIVELITEAKLWNGIIPEADDPIGMIPKNYYDMPEEEACERGLLPYWRVCNKEGKILGQFSMKEFEMVVLNKGEIGQ